MLLAQVFGVLMNVTTRLLEVEGNKGKGLDPFQILFARMGITVVLASLWMWWKKTPDFPLGKKEVRGLLAARGFGGFFGVFGKSCFLSSFNSLGGSKTLCLMIIYLGRDRFANYPFYTT